MMMMMTIVEDKRIRMTTFPTITQHTEAQILCVEIIEFWVWEKVVSFHVSLLASLCLRRRS